MLNLKDPPTVTDCPCDFKKKLLFSISWYHGMQRRVVEMFTYTPYLLPFSVFSYNSSWIINETILSVIIAYIIPLFEIELK